jgi:hypothetical protein
MLSNAHPRLRLQEQQLRPKDGNRKRALSTFRCGITRTSVALRCTENLLADGSTTTLEGETLEIMTDGKRVSPYESRTGGALPYPSFRYELDNLICSAALKLDDQVQIISHEK